MENGLKIRSAGEMAGYRSRYGGTLRSARSRWRRIRPPLRLLPFGRYRSNPASYISPSPNQKPSSWHVTVEPRPVLVVRMPLPPPPPPPPMPSQRQFLSRTVRDLLISCPCPSLNTCYFKKPIKSVRATLPVLQKDGQNNLENTNASVHENC